MALLHCRGRTLYDPMQHKAPQRLEPWTGERTRHTSADAFFAPPSSAKSGYALESPTSKLGSLLVLLAISSVAAVGMFMPAEDDPLASATKVASGVPSKIHLPHSEKRFVPETVSVPQNAPQQAYALAYELARQRVKTVGGLTRPQRLEAGREAIAQVLGANVSQLDTTATAGLAKQAPEEVKKAAFRGVNKGEAMGISEQSQLLVRRMLSREKRPQPE